MIDLLKDIKENNTEISFLLPGLAGEPVKGRVEAISSANDRVTLICVFHENRIRIVTHPNSVVLVEQV